MKGLVKKLFILPVRGYQKFISPLLGKNCRFMPTCSAYMIEAIEVHGVAKGLLLGLWRILRCNPFGKGGFDLCPPRAAGATGQRPERHRHKMQAFEIRAAAHRASL